MARWTPEELARLTPDELAELRQVYAEGHAAGYAVGYAESYVKGVRDALADRRLDTEREVPPDAWHPGAGAADAGGR